MTDENKNRARELAEQDARAARKRIREHIGAANFNVVAFEDPDRSSWPAGDGARMLLPVTIGVRGNLTRLKRAIATADRFIGSGLLPDGVTTPKTPRPD